MTTYTPLLNLLLALSVWLTPLPRHAQGRLVLYGPQRLVEVNAEFRGYDLAPYKNRCGVAVMSPADLGKIIWLRVDDGAWVGPCLAIDVAQRRHFLEYVNELHEVAEISYGVRKVLGLTDNGYGEVYVGACVPEHLGAAQDYRVIPAYTTNPYHPSFFPYPAQQLPDDCDARLELRR